MGLVAQLPKVLARQEAPAECNVLEVLEATWCLVWDSQWEERIYQPAGHFHSCLLEDFALFHSDSYRPRNPLVRQSLVQNLSILHTFGQQQPRESQNVMQAELVKLEV